MVLWASAIEFVEKHCAKSLFPVIYQEKVFLILVIGCFVFKQLFRQYTQEAFCHVHLKIWRVE